MDCGLGYRLCRGEEFDGEKYYCSLYVDIYPPHNLPPPKYPPEDGKQYFIFTVKYNHDTRPDRVCLFRRQRVIECRQFCSSVDSILSDMLADMPWKLPQELQTLAGPWIIDSAIDAVHTDILEYRDAFRAARFLSLEMVVSGPSQEGGEEYSDRYEDHYDAEAEDEDEDGDEDEEEEEFVPLEIEVIVSRLKSVSLGGDEDEDEDENKVKNKEEDCICGDSRMCSMCLEELERDGKEVVKTWCEHVFHKDCLVPWLQRRPSCPYCRTWMVEI